MSYESPGYFSFDFSTLPIRERSLVTNTDPLCLDFSGQPMGSGLSLARYFQIWMNINHNKRINAGNYRYLFQNKISSEPSSLYSGIGGDGEIRRTLPIFIPYGVFDTTGLPATHVTSANDSTGPLFPTPFGGNTYLVSAPEEHIVDYENFGVKYNTKITYWPVDVSSLPPTRIEEPREIYYNRINLFEVYSKTVGAGNYPFALDIIDDVNPPNYDRAWKDYDDAELQYLATKFNLFLLPQAINTTHSYSMSDIPIYPTFYDAKSKQYQVFSVAQLWLKKVDETTLKIQASPFSYFYIGEMSIPIITDTTFKRTWQGNSNRKFKSRSFARFDELNTNENYFYIWFN